MGKNSPKNINKFSTVTHIKENLWKKNKCDVTWRYPFFYKTNSWWGWVSAVTQFPTILSPEKTKTKPMSYNMNERDAMHAELKALRSENLLLRKQTENDNKTIQSLLTRANVENANLLDRIKHYEELQKLSERCKNDIVADINENPAFTCFDDVEDAVSEENHVAQNVAPSPQVVPAFDPSPLSQASEEGAPYQPPAPCTPPPTPPSTENTTPNKRPRDENDQITPVNKRVKPNSSPGQRGRKGFLTFLHKNLLDQHVSMNLHRLNEMDANTNKKVTYMSIKQDAIAHLASQFSEIVGNEKKCNTYFQNNFGIHNNPYITGLSQSIATAVIDFQSNHLHTYTHQGKAVEEYEIELVDGCWTKTGMSAWEAPEKMTKQKFKGVLKEAMRFEMFRQNILSHNAQ